jgi:hypothetical protein
MQCFCVDEIFSVLVKVSVCGLSQMITALEHDRIHCTHKQRLRRPRPRAELSSPLEQPTAALHLDNEDADPSRSFPSVGQIVNLLDQVLARLLDSGSS